MTGVRAAASLVAERGPDGATRCTSLRSDPPITLRATGPDTIQLVGSGAGPVGGDDLRLDVRVGPGARLRVHSVAASIILPGPAAQPSSSAVTVDVGEGGSLWWAPEPTVAVRGCDHRTTVAVSLSAGARLWWQEVIVLGRHDEVPGSLVQRLRVDVGGRPLTRSDLALGPRWPGWSGPAGVDGHRVVATGLAVARGAGRVGDLAVEQGVRAAVFPLDDDAAMVSVVASRPDAATRVLDVVASCVTGHAATPSAGEAAHNVAASRAFGPNCDN